MKVKTNQNMHCVVETIALTSLYSVLLYLSAQLVLNLI